MKYTGSIKDMRSCMWLRNHIKISCRFSIFFLGKNIITYLYICAFCHCFHCHCYRHICYYCHRRNHIKISCRFSIFFLERTVEYEQCQLYSILDGSDLMDVTSLPSDCYRLLVWCWMETFMMLVQVPPAMSAGCAVDPSQEQNRSTMGRQIAGKRKDKQISHMTEWQPVCRQTTSLQEADWNNSTSKQ